MNIQGTTDNETAFQLRLRFETTYRKLNISIELAHTEVMEEKQDRESSLVAFKVSRRF